MTNCPVCGAEMDLDPDDLELDDTITCDWCDADLTVAGTDPIELDPLDEDETPDEDQQDEDEDDDDLDFEEEEEEEHQT